MRDCSCKKSNCFNQDLQKLEIRKLPKRSQKCSKGVPIYFIIKSNFHTPCNNATRYVDKKFYHLSFYIPDLKRKLATKGFQCSKISNFEFAKTFILLNQDASIFTENVNLKFIAF